MTFDPGPFEIGLLWIGAFLIVAWLTPRKAQGPLMLLCALGYVANGDRRSLAVLLAAGASSHLLLLGRPDRVRLVGIVAVMIGLLGWTRWGTTFGQESPTRIIGVSFYALRIIHVSVDRVRGRIGACSFLDYLSYLAFLPAFVTGPIHRLDDFQRDERRRRWDAGRFALGMERALHGTAKIVVLGDWGVSYLSGVLAAHPSSPWLREYQAAWLSWANLYFQFAGRADIAVGLAGMVGHRLPENFNWPFLAPNITAFWLRWHITLGAWCREYVFQPVMALTRSPIVGIAAGMLAIGLWHSLSPRYLLWGLYHAAGIGAWYAFQRLKRGWQAPKSRVVRGALHALAILATIHFVVLSEPVTTRITGWLGFTPAAAPIPITDSEGADDV